MDTQTANHRVEPGISLGVACALLLILGILGIHYLKRPAPAPVMPGAAPPAAAEPAPGAPLPPVAAIDSSALETQWGIQVSSVGLLLDNAAVCFNYKVITPDKATLLSDESTPAFLVDQASGTKIPLRVAAPEGAVPAHSRARSAAAMSQRPGAFPPARNKLFSGQAYSVLVPNPDRVLRSGSKVAVVIGDVQVDGLTVQ